MELGPEVVSCPHTQEFPNTLWNLKVHSMHTRALHWSLSRPSKWVLCHHNIVCPNIADQEDTSPDMEETCKYNE
jgi:hypothetical protein